MLYPWLYREGIKLVQANYFVEPHCVSLNSFECSNPRIIGRLNRVHGDVHAKDNWEEIRARGRTYEKNPRPR